MSPDLLRKWERRYGVLTPARTVGNQRLYSRLDEARARVMLRHLRDGVPPAQAAELAIATKFRIATEQESDAGLDRQRARLEMQAALERYDESAAERAVEKLLATSTTAVVIRDVFLAYMGEIGQRWVSGHLNVAQEHFASSFILGRLLTLARGWDHGLGPRALLACPPHEQHTLGLISFGIALHEIGWRITYLGADTPIPMIAKAAAYVQPQLTVIAAVMPDRLDAVADQLRPLASARTVALAGAASSARLASQCQATHLAADPITAAHSLAR